MSTPSTPDADHDRADYTSNFEAAQYHSQQPLPPGQFRGYDGQPVAAVQQQQQQHHHRQDSNGSNGLAKVAIPKNGRVTVKREDSNTGSPPNTANAAMTAIRSGPMSKEVQVQPRPRPGRKPMAGEDKEDRRRLQNRMAQRAFRDKRAQKNVELEHEINRLKAEFQQHEADYRNTIAELRTSCQEKDRQNAELNTNKTSLEARVAKQEQRVADLERQLKLANSNVGSFRDVTGQPADQRPSSVPTPPESNYEIDFTNYGRATGSTYGLRNTLSNDSNAMDFSVDNEDPCGFCTDDQNCACKQEQQQRQRPKPTPIEPRVSATLPGSCDMCQSDPERARACKEMAAATRPAGSTTPRTSSSFGSRPSLTSTTMPPPRMSCSAMVDEFNKFGERTSSIGGLFGGRRLNAYPRETGGGFDLEEAQAAEVLSTLHRRSEGAISVSSFADSQSGQGSTSM
ncbi:putative basic-leucine zipper domain-containing protein [Septoria linicola]|nr:putative basic-leucine zipper domain-containing protein [Septoria linicola]